MARKWVLTQHGGLSRKLRRYGTALILVAVALVATAFVALLWRGAAWLDASRLHGLTPVQRETAIDAIRGRLLQLGAGLVIATGLVYTALTFRLNREGHVTERYTKAIDQLGSERLDVRLGAIYALERIMIDSPRDHPTIVEVLAAYVREHAPPQESGTLDVGTETKNAPATDVQAALTVLGRRPSGRAERGRLDLRRTRLMGMDLANADLRGANLPGATLILATLTRADLTGADLTGATLTGAALNSANLIGANLSAAALRDVTLHSADLNGADLTGADLTRADLKNAYLTGAIMTGAILTDAELPRGFATGGQGVEACSPTPPDS